MKKILLLFLFSAMFVGCENSGTDIFAPNEQSAGKDQLSVQSASGMTINFALEDQALNAYETTLTMEFNSAVHPFDGSIVCFTSLKGTTPTHVEWGPVEFGYVAPLSAKLEIDMANVPEGDCYANVSFRGGSTSEMVILLTKQGGGKCVAEFDMSSEFCEKLRQMFSQMGEQKLSECLITVKIAHPDIDNPVSGSWLSASKEVVVTAKYPVTTKTVVDYLITNINGAAVYPTDRYALTLIIPQGETSAKAYLPDFNETQPPAVVRILKARPHPDLYSLVSGTWVKASKEFVLSTKDPIEWDVEVEYFFTNTVGEHVYPKGQLFRTAIIPRGATSVKVYLSDFDEPQPPTIVRFWDMRLKYETGY